jgi:hypothetical protein
MAYSQRAITWARRQKPVVCGCGCEVEIIARPAWYVRKDNPPRHRYVTGHGLRADETVAQTVPEADEVGRPEPGVIMGKKNTNPDAVIVICSCGVQWKVSPTIGYLITSEACSYCSTDTIVAGRIAEGLEPYPDDDLDESEGGVDMSVTTYFKLKAMYPFNNELPRHALTLGDLAHQLKTGTFRGTSQMAAEVRDILDQCGLSEEYIP